MTSTHAMPTGTVTMLFTDIEGSTRLLKELGPQYGELLAEHRRILREAFAAHEGREMDTQGDAFFVAFARARNAVEAAVDGQRGLAAQAWPGGVVCRVRMGLHTGEPSVGDEGYHGIGLHRGARIAAAAHGGQILLSTSTAELIKEDLPAAVRLRDLGNQRLKDIDGPERIFQVVADGLQSEFPPLRAGPSKRRRGRWPAIAVAVALVAAVAAAAIILGTHGSGRTASAALVSADSVGVFRAGSGGLQGQIPVGASPSAITVGDGSIWAANVDAHTVSRVDPGKEVTIDTIPVGNGPDGIAVGGGFVWVTNGLDGTVTQIDPKGNTPVQAIPVGSGPAGVAVDSRYVWVANSNDGTVTRIDLRTDKPLSPIAIGQSADGIAIGYGSVWVTSQSTGTVTRIDERTGNVIQPIQAGSGADAVAVGLDSVWSANSLDGTVTRIDPATNTVRAAIPVGAGPNGIAVADGTVWVSNELSGTLSRIDPIRNVTVHTVPTGNRPEGLVFDSGALYVAVRASGVGHRGGTLRVLGSSQNVASVDPALASNLEEDALQVLTGDGLDGFLKVGGSAGTRLVPDLAVSLPAPADGGRSYSFQLRPGIRYSTGALVRPDDFRRALERDVELEGVGAGWTGIVGTRGCVASPKKPCDLSRGVVTDAASNTVTFHLTSPDPNFLYSLTNSNSYPVPAGTPLHPRGFVPGTGPYRIVSFDPKRGIRLVRNPRFHEWSPAAQPAGYPDVIIERFGGSSDQHIGAVLRGSADLATGVAAPSPGVIESLRTQHLSQLKLTPWASTWFIVLNTRLAPFDNVNARRAFNFAVDRAHLRDLTLGQGLGTVTCQILPPDMDGYQRYCPYTAAPSKSGAWTAPDLARARRLVRQSGTTGQQITFWIPKWIHFSAASGRYVVSVLDSLGYKARLRIVADPYPTENKLGLQAGFYAWGPYFAAPAGFIPGALNCASYLPQSPLNENTAEFCDPAVDREIARAESLQTSDVEAARLLWAKIDRDLTGQAPWVPIANGVVFEVVSTRVGNYQYNPSWGTLLDQLWVR